MHVRIRLDDRVTGSPFHRMKNESHHLFTELMFLSLMSDEKVFSLQCVPRVLSSRRTSRPHEQEMRISLSFFFSRFILITDYF